MKVLSTLLTGAVLLAAASTAAHAVIIDDFSSSSNVGGRYWTMNTWQGGGATYTINEKQQLAPNNTNVDRATKSNTTYFTSKTGGTFAKDSEDILSIDVISVAAANSGAGIALDFGSGSYFDTSIRYENGAYILNVSGAIAAGTAKTSLTGLDLAQGFATINLTRNFGVYNWSVTGGGLTSAITGSFTKTGVFSTGSSYFGMSIAFGIGAESGSIIVDNLARTSPSEIPEPASITLLAAGSLLCLRRR